MKSPVDAAGTTQPMPRAAVFPDLKPLVRSKDDGQFHRGVTNHVSELTGATALLYSETAGILTILATRIRGSLPGGLLDAKETRATLSSALQSRAMVTHKLGMTGLILWAMPIDGETSTGLALLFASGLTKAKEDSLLPLLAIPQALFAQRNLQLANEAQKQGFDQSCFFLEALYRSSSAPTFHRAIQSLVEDLRIFMGAESTAMGFGSRITCRIEAMGPASKFDHRSQMAVRTSQLMREGIAVKGTIGWPQEGLPPAHPGLHLAGDHDPLLEELKVKAVTCHLLQSANGDIIGSWVCWWKTPPSQEKLQLADAISPHLGATAHMIRLARPKGLVGFFQRHVAEAKWSMILSVLALLVLLSAGLAWKIPYKVSAPCWIDPGQRRQVAVPFDGILAQANVKPGDRVAANQILAVLDGKEFQWKLADVKSRLASIKKRRDQALAVENMPDTQLASLEMASLQVEQDLLVYQNENLNIRSPLDGVIIAGDLAQSEGVPVQRGQRLFDVAPIDFFSLELAVPADEILHVTPGMPITVRLESEAAFQQTGVLDSLEPSSRVHESKNVFIGHTTLSNPDGRLRPGMRGKALIIAPPRSLGWILFHRPIEFLRMHLPW